MLAIRERVENKQVKLSYIQTSEQVADIMTKPLPSQKFSCFVSKLTMIIIPLLFLITSYQESDALRIGLGRFAPISKKTTNKLILKITGHLATQELAEMLERHELRDISPEETVLISVSVNSREKEIEFVHKLKVSVEFTTEQLLLIGAIGALMGVICFMVATNVEVLNTLRGQGQDHDYEEPVESSRATSRRLRFALEDALD